jgi:hypothetical protein
MEPKPRTGQFAFVENVDCPVRAPGPIAPRTRIKKKCFSACNHFRDFRRLVLDGGLDEESCG